MYILKLTLLLSAILTHLSLPSEKTVLLFQTRQACLDAQEGETEKLLDHASAKSKELQIAIHASVIGGCKAPTNLKSAAQPPESSGG